MKINIGDIVEVLNTGWTYSTHMKAAKELGADYDQDEYDQVYLSGDWDSSIRIKTESKWRWSGSPSRGDICQVISEWNGHHLIERKKDGRQFVMDLQGCKFLHNPMALKDDLFEL